MFLKKVREYDSRLQSKRRGELTAAQKDELDSFENQIVSLIGWLVLAYAGPPETTNCGSATFHDWHLEIFESPSDHAPQVGDPTPIICEITPRTEQRLYRDGVRIQSLAGFFRLQDVSYPCYRAQGAENSRDWLSHVGRRPQRKRRRWLDYPVFRHERISSSVALDGVGNSSGHENRSNRMKEWEIIADNLSKAGWSWGCVSAIDSSGRTIWIADAHHGDGKRFIVHADELLTAFVELELAIRVCGELV